MKNKKIICGIDEAGRGALAGPVMAAACILPPDFPVNILKDSKKLSAKKRENAAKVIKEKAFWASAFSSEKEIDEINILQATLLAMSRAFQKLVLQLKNEGQNETLEALHVIIDGLYVPFDMKNYASALVKADDKVPSVMAASILAKTTRDAVMTENAKLYPEYGYEKHKGYPTKAHKEALRNFGESPIQRKTFSY